MVQGSARVWSGLGLVQWSIRVLEGHWLVWFSRWLGWNDWPIASWLECFGFVARSMGFGAGLCSGYAACVGWSMRVLGEVRTVRFSPCFSCCRCPNAFDPCCPFWMRSGLSLGRGRVGAAQVRRWDPLGPSHEPSRSMRGLVVYATGLRGPILFLPT